MPRSFKFSTPFLLTLLIFTIFPFPAAALTFSPNASTTPYVRRDAGLDKVLPPRSCHRSLGRSAFFLLPARNYGLSAVALYLDYPGSLDFSPIKISVYQVLGFTTEPDFSAPLTPKDLSFDPGKVSVAYESSGRTVWEVLFPLRTEISLTGGRRLVIIVECLVPEDKSFKLWERSSGWGQYNFIDSSTTPPTRGASGKRLAFTFFEGKPKSPSYHPVIFVRGAGRETSDWDGILNGLGFQESYTGNFDFNENKSIKDNAKDLKDLVDSLSQNSWNDWGDGKVDLVGYSLGGLIAHRYLLDNAGKHHIRKFISISTPFKGTPWVDFDSQVRAMPRLGKWLKKKFEGGLRALIGAKKSDFKTSQTAFSQMAAGSSYIKNLDQRGLPKDLSYLSLYGNIAAEYRQSLFKFAIKKKENLGDLFVPADSATAIEAQNLEKISFQDEGKFIAKIAVNGEGASVEFEGPELGKLRYYHNNLLSQSAVKNKIKDLLSQ